MTIGFQIRPSAIGLWCVLALGAWVHGWSQDREIGPAADGSYLGFLNGVKHGSVVYAAGSDYELKCDVYVPNGDGPFPAILAVHGGGWRGGSKAHLIRHAFKFCDDGFVVVCINYRHAPKYPFPAQIQDCFAALRFMHENAATYQIDSNQWLGFGYSAGGHLISLLATTSESDWLDGQKDQPTGSLPRLRAVVAGGAPCDFDWLSDDSIVLKYWLGATKGENPDLYQRASPVDQVSALSPPFFLFHGNADQLVPVSCAERMQASLIEHGVICQVLPLQGRGHLEAFTQLDTMDKACEFFHRQLAERTPEPKRSNLPQGR